MRDYIKPTYAMLVIQLQDTTRELERLYSLHKDQFEGKIGCPNVVIIDQVKSILENI